MTIAPPSEDREVVTSDGMVVDPLRAVHTVQGTVHFEPLVILWPIAYGSLPMTHWQNKPITADKTRKNKISRRRNGTVWNLIRLLDGYKLFC